MKLARRVRRVHLFAVAFGSIPVMPALAQQAATPAFTHADTLRGTITPERAWWDVVFYDLHVKIDPADSTVHGWNGITYRVSLVPRQGTPRSRRPQMHLRLPPAWTGNSPLPGMRPGIRLG